MASVFFINDLRDQFNRRENISNVLMEEYAYG